MPRALATHGWHFARDQRANVLESLRTRRATLKEHGCNYWVFEHQETPGVVLEFFEGPDPDTLARARQAAGVADANDAVFLEVEF